MGMSNAERQRRFIAKLKAQAAGRAVTNAETRIRKLEAELAQQEEQWRSLMDNRGIKFSSADYRLILSCLHPDAVTDSHAKKRYERAFKLFTSQLPESAFREKGKAPDRNRPPAMPKASDLALRKAARKAKRGAKKRTKPKP